MTVGGVLAGCSRVENGILTPVLPGKPGDPIDLEIALRAEPGEVAIFDGRSTQVWSYQASLLAGDRSALEILPNSYLGPIIRVRRGQRVRIQFENQVEEPTIVHWHGLLVPPEMDGHPRDVVQPGETSTYEFPVINRAGTYWFHPHPHQLTGPQVYRGLAGLFLVSDDEEAALDLPSGEYDVPLVIQDRSFDTGNQLIYLPNGMMDRMLGFLGDQILVNGHPDFTLLAARRAYRLRLLNGSNARVYKLAWEDGEPLTVIGTDGGLLEKPVERNYVTLGPAERIELWVDFARWPLGQKLRLISLPFATGSMMGMMGPGAQSTLGSGSEFSVLTVSIEHEAGDTSRLPQTLAGIERYEQSASVNARSPRIFRLGMGGMGGMGMRRGGMGMSWTINGRVFEMDEVARDEIVQLGTQEAWIFDNTDRGGGMGGMGGMMGGMMQLSHPMHVHGVQFQVVGREVLPAFKDVWTSLSEGFIDDGWKDSVLVLPGELVTVLMRFQGYPGLFLNHCHNLEHEDLGMMRNYRIDK